MPENPYWLLIAVLQSSLPLEPALAMRLYHAAVELERDALGVARLDGDLAQGELRRLGKRLLLGTISGPGFEAEVDTPRGSGRVRFVLTPEGLAQMGVEPSREAAVPAATRRMLN